MLYINPTNHFHPHAPFSSDPTPSFALMDIQGPVVVTYVYQLIEGEVRVEKIEYRKDAEALAAREREAAAPRSTVMPQSIPSAGSASQQSVW
jgi:vacuolar protein sorting-associated protein 29